MIPKKIFMLLGTLVHLSQSNVLLPVVNEGLEHPPTHTHTYIAQGLKEHVTGEAVEVLV